MIISTTTAAYIPSEYMMSSYEYPKNMTHIFIATHSDFYEPLLLAALLQQEYVLRIYITRAMAVYKSSTIDLLFTSSTKVELVLVNTNGAFREILYKKHPELLL
jgi:hypothetical protein